ncbi:unnamed protein product [Arctogadus glacialis]
MTSDEHVTAALHIFYRQRSRFYFAFHQKVFFGAGAYIYYTELNQHHSASVLLVGLRAAHVKYMLLTLQRMLLPRVLG